MLLLTQQTIPFSPDREDYLEGRNPSQFTIWFRYVLKAWCSNSGSQGKIFSFMLCWCGKWPRQTGMSQTAFLVIKKEMESGQKLKLCQFQISIFMAPLTVTRLPTALGDLTHVLSVLSTGGKDYRRSQGKGLQLNRNSVPAFPSLQNGLTLAQVSPSWRSGSPGHSSYSGHLPRLLSNGTLRTH